MRRSTYLTGLGAISMLAGFILPIMPVYGQTMTYPYAQQPNAPTPPAVVQPNQSPGQYPAATNYPYAQQPVPPAPIAAAQSGKNYNNTYPYNPYNSTSLGAVVSQPAVTPTAPAVPTNGDFVPSDTTETTAGISKAGRSANGALSSTGSALGR